MFASLRSLIVAGLVLAAALSATILTSGPPKDPPPAPRPAASVAELTDRLQPLGLRVVLPPAGDDPDRGVFLTTTDKSRRELAAAIPGDETARGVKEWAGTLRVHLLTRWNGDEHGDVQLPGAMAWRWGRLVFFGDAELLERVQALLTGAGDGPLAVRHDDWQKSPTETTR